MLSVLDDFDFNIDALDELVNSEILDNITDESFFASLSSHEENGCSADNDKEILNEGFLDKVSHHDFLNLLKTLPSEIEREERVAAAGDCLSLGSCLDISLFPQEIGTPDCDACFEEEFFTSETSKHQVDFFQDSENITNNFSIAKKESVQDLMSARKEYKINEIEGYKSSFSASKSPGFSNLNACVLSEKDFEESIPKPKRQKIEKSSIFSNNDCDYRDFSCLTDDEVFFGLNFTNVKGRPEEPFPAKLHKILDRSEADGYSSIISWLPHGRAFKIHDKSLFVEQVMPKYFYQSKLSSFLRQLKMYGFYKLKNGLDKGAYCQELFLNGRLGLCAAIIRQTKNIKVAFTKEPNFYEMPSLNSTLTTLSQAHGEPRTIIYVPEENKTESDDAVSESRSDPEHVTNAKAPCTNLVLPALSLPTPCSRPVSVSDKTTPRKRSVTLENSRPIPIRVIRNGIPLTKKKIKSCGISTSIEL